MDGMVSLVVFGNQRVDTPRDEVVNPSYHRSALLKDVTALDIACEIALADGHKLMQDSTPATDEVSEW